MTIIEIELDSPDITDMIKSGKDIKELLYYIPDMYEGEGTATIICPNCGFISNGNCFWPKGYEDPFFVCQRGEEIDQEFNRCVYAVDPDSTQIVAKGGDRYLATISTLPFRYELVTNEEREKNGEWHVYEYDNKKYWKFVSKDGFEEIIAIDQIVETEEELKSKSLRKMDCDFFVSKESLEIIGEFLVEKDGKLIYYFGCGD